MSIGNENSSGEEYSDSASESEEDITTLLRLDRWGFCAVNKLPPLLAIKSLPVISGQVFRFY